MGAVLTLIPFLFGDLRGYLAIAEYVSAQKWIVYALLCLPFICVALLGAFKVIGDELLRVSSESGTIQRPLYKRGKLHAQRQLQLDGVVTAHNKVEIQVIADVPLRSVRHRRTVVEAGEFKEPDLEFEAGYRDGAGDMRPRILNKTGNVITWAVEFTPPLLKGQQAAYAYRQSSGGPFAMTLEKIHEDIAAGLRVTDFSHWRFHMVAPTDELYMKIEFPPGYQITLPSSGGFNVYLGTTEYGAERDRLMAERAFSARLDPLSNRWVIELLINHAQMGLTYVLEWIPPTKAAVETLSRGGS